MSLVEASAAHLRYPAKTQPKLKALPAAHPATPTNQLHSSLLDENSRNRIASQ